MRKITIGMVILSIILIGMVIPAGYLTLIHFSKVKAIWI